MLQRWLKTLTAVSLTCVLFSACKKNTYSSDEPLIASNTPSVFISSQNKILYALDPVSGKQKWQYNLHSNVVATPIVIGDFLFVASLDTVFKLDVNKGTLVRKYCFGPEEPMVGFISSPTTDTRSLFLARRDGKIYCLDARADSVLNWTYDVADSVEASLVIYNGSLLVASYHNVTAINLNGTLNWTVASPGGTLRSSPAVSLPYIYVGSDDFNMYALNATNGTLAWQFATLGIINSSPIVYGGNVIFGSADNYVYCLDTAAKAVRWKFKTQDRVMASPAAYGQVVYIGGYDSYMYGLNIIDGTLKWRFKTNGLIQSSAVAQNGRIYVSGYDKQLYSFDTTGAQKWFFNVGGPVETSPVYYDLSKTYYPSITGQYQY
jgi:outer membrane protein assembly factor BamB